MPPSEFLGCVGEPFTTTEIYGLEELCSAGHPKDGMIIKIKLAATNALIDFIGVFSLVM
jgi:hypothetical protein